MRGRLKDLPLSESLSFIAKGLHQELPLSRPTPFVVNVDRNGIAIIQLGY